MTIPIYRKTKRASSLNGMETSGKLSVEIMKTPTDETHPQEYEEKKA
jgi:hypothetical protein